LAVRRVALGDGEGGPAHAAAQERFKLREAELQRRYAALAAEANALKDRDGRDRALLADIDGREKDMPLSALVRFYPANGLGLAEKLGVYLSRWREFLVDEPREANTEGGIMPAIFGTFALTVLMVVAVAPFGVITALYLREYARQGRIVAAVRISVNNLAGVPSIVYGVFGLGFFAYFLGGTIDQLFFPERLPSPTFGTGGLLWSSLTLALLTVPVVIVATEEALAAVPRSMREGSLACGASKWQTIQRIVLPRAMPGIMTGIILAMARGAGEVAPLMLVGVVKLAPELPIDGYFPFVHLERSFMHLGFHIYDVGFQSRNSEAGKPMVFVTTLLLIALIFVMNIGAIAIRNRLKRKFAGSQF
jgi:phosphate transport system permease protein